MHIAVFSLCQGELLLSIYKYLQFKTNRTMEDEKCDIVDTHENLSVCEYLASSGINVNKFNLPLWFWCNLNSMKDCDWFELTDELIKEIGFKSCESNPSINRSNLFARVRKKFIKGKEYRITDVKVTKHGRGGAQFKNILEMTKTAFITLLQYTFELRTNKKKTESHFMYVLHNPMFLHYGPNVYKIGYTTDTSSRLKGFSTGYVEPSKMVYYKQVTSKKCELILHKMMSKYRMSTNREFFDCPLPIIKDFMEQL